MNLRLLSCLLGGALFASAAFNLHLCRVDTPCPLCAVPSPAQVQDCIECLALTPVQRAVLVQQCSSCCSSATAVEQRITAIRIELRAALRSAPIDEAKVRELGQKLVALRGAAITAGIEAALHLRSVLSEEQIAKLEQTLGTTEYR